MADASGDLIHPAALDLADEETEAGVDAGAGTEAERVARLLRLLGKCIRSHQLYNADNPVRQRFTESLHEAFADLWGYLEPLELRVEEGAFVWSGVSCEVGEGRESLPFVFYKDGIRFITFEPGFEDGVEPFLDVLNRARVADKYGDDLVTLLWEADLPHFRFGYMDQLADTVALPEPGAGLLEPVPPELIQREIDEAGPGASERREGADTEAADAERPPEFGAGQFEETLLFLDDREIATLRTELDREWQRDLKADVLNALFDRLEDEPPLQAEIVTVLRQILPVFLARGDLGYAATVLLELQTLLDQDDVLPETIEAEAAAVFDELSTPAMLQQLFQAVEEGAIDAGATELGIFINYLRPEALPVLLGATERTQVPALRDRFRSAIEGMARQNVDALVALVDDPDPLLAAGAARIAGRLALPATVPALQRLIGHEDATLRLAAVEALAAMKSAAAVEPLHRAVGDDDRDVRIAAARGIGALRHAPARAVLERILEDRAIRDADLTEKIAFFEAYAAVAGGDSVPLLDRLLNSRSLIGGRQPPEIRACAARALGRVATPTAEKALRTAASDKEPLVRTAALGALRRDSRP